MAVLALGVALCALPLFRSSAPPLQKPFRGLSHFSGETSGEGSLVSSSYDLSSFPSSPVLSTSFQDCLAPSHFVRLLKDTGAQDLPPPSIRFHVISKTYQVNKGDTVATVLSRAGLPKEQVSKVMQSMRSVFDARELKLGQPILLKLRKEGASVSLVNLQMNPSAEQVIYLQSLPSGVIQAQKIRRQLIRSLRRVEGRIGCSFYAAALKAGVPAPLVKEAINVLSHNVNWQSDPRHGDPFYFLFEVMTDAEGQLVKTGDLRFISFAPRGVRHSIYRHILKDKTVGYYNASGQSVTRSLLMTPLDPTKMQISSKFGLRRHPIQGYHKHHKGVDYRAPTGTPVRASGSGVVMRASYYGNYGNYVSIKHNKEYSTAYAHLSRYAKGIRPGSVVRQGEIIGYVGATGSATGAHLHYEVIYRGSQINPANIRHLPGKKLDMTEHSRFQLTRSQVDQMLKSQKEEPIKQQIAAAESLRTAAKPSTPNLYALRYQRSIKDLQGREPAAGHIIG